MKLTWFAGDEVAEQERKAIDKALSYTNYELNDEELQEWINDDTISLSTCRNGRDVVWLLLENGEEHCVYVDDLTELDENAIAKELL